MTGKAEYLNSVTTLSLLYFGFILGLKHAIDADHLAAVSTIATERRHLLSATLIGALWGLGHTISLFVAGIVVIFLHLEISVRTSQILELCVGVMLIGLGINALRKLAKRGHVHMHVHEHGGHEHAHPHIHHEGQKEEPHTHHGLSFGARPLFIGIVHGMAGSAALMLMVLATISSPSVALMYIAVFGVGSIGGMMIMSTLFAIPAKLTASRFRRANLALRGLAGLFSLCFGLFMVYEIGFAGNLFR
ncbi:MAG TPA: hypothetical protein VN643_04445 [Pyrinomonadaceae bacterium]|nr:hypothetical protein [Pyrinomonadaceae bacterium]